MISNAGRMVCAVVWAAPETMPSASPRCTIMVPKYETSVTISRARSTVMPLCARSLAYAAANRSTQLGVGGRDDRRRVDVEAERGGLGPDLVLLAEQGQVGDARAQQDRGGPQDPFVGRLRAARRAAGRPGPARSAGTRTSAAW